MKAYYRTPIPPELVAYAVDEATVSAALSYIAVLPATWSSLYMALEVVQHDVGGKDAMIATTWICRRQLVQFTQTANSPAAIGTAARHGRQREAIPSEPMLLEDARRLIRDVANKWLTRRFEAASGLELKAHGS